MKNKRVLITGGTGFIGSFLTELLCSDNELTLFDNGRRNTFQFLPKSVQNKVYLIEGDIQDFETVQKITQNKDIIIHLAAIAGVSSYEKDSLLTMNVNFFGTANLLRSLVDTRVEKVILFSTSEVYGPQAVNVSEDSLTCIGPTSEGRWSYAISKVAADHLAMAYFKKYKLPVTMVRPFNIYGPRQVGEGAIGNMFKNAIQTGKILVTGDGGQKRSWCFIKDLVTAIELIYQKKTSGECFNIGNPNVYLTILELAEKIQALTKAEIVFTKGKKVEVKERLPNIDKARNILGYKPAVGLYEGLKITFNWFRQNIKSVKF